MIDDPYFQSGGLLGLARRLGLEAVQGVVVAGIAARRARACYGDLGLVPSADLTEEMLGYRLEKHGSKWRP